MHRSLPFSSSWQRVLRATATATARRRHQRRMPTESRRLFSNFVKIVEVGPRDGLQNESNPISTQQKIQFITRLADAGCPVMEAGSFVSPKWVPQMADSSQVMDALQVWRRQTQPQPQPQPQPQDANTTRRSPLFSCLVPNLQGLLQAIKCQADEVAIFASASEMFSQTNLNCSIEESLERFTVVAHHAAEQKIPLRGYVSCVVACPYAGAVAPAAVAHVVEQLLQLGCHEISLGDTIGVGTPGSTRAMLDAVKVRTCVGLPYMYIHAYPAVW
jgi:hydroxymethylglutaryl-CoA lyase